MVKKIGMDNRFTDIIHLIKVSRTNAVKAINAELIDLYWSIGKYISKKLRNQNGVTQLYQN